MSLNFNPEYLRDQLSSGLLYGITDINPFCSSHLISAQRLVKAGVQVVQYRAKGISPARQLEELTLLVPWARSQGCSVIVNDFAELAAAVGAAGVHLGQGDGAVKQARARLKPGQLIGLSTHNLTQVRLAEKAGADYLGVGPAYATSSKPDEPVAGLAFLTQAAQHCALPQVAIGGIDEARLEEVCLTGQRTVAMISALANPLFLADRVSRIAQRLKVRQ